MGFYTSVKTDPPDELQRLPAVAGGKVHYVLPEGALLSLPAGTDSSSNQCVNRVCTYLRITRLKNYV